MNEDGSMTRMNRLEATLDTALARALSPPPTPPEFRSRLNAALIRQASASEQSERERLELEHREWLARFDAGYVRLRRRTLGTLIGAAFAAGAVVAFAMPWLNATFGPGAMWIVATLGALVGLAIGIGSWLRRMGWRNLLDIL